MQRKKENANQGKAPQKQALEKLAGTIESLAQLQKLQAGLISQMKKDILAAKS